MLEHNSLSGPEDSRRPLLAGGATLDDDGGTRLLKLLPRHFNFRLSYKISETKLQSIHIKMARYVAFLRGVTPMNLKMSDLQRCLESDGFLEVKTLLSSGNVAFTSAGKSTAAIERKLETVMTKYLGRTFFTIVRFREELLRIIASDPFAAFALPAQGKRVVTFARSLVKLQRLPIE